MAELLAGEMAASMAGNEVAARVVQMAGQSGLPLADARVVWMDQKMVAWWVAE